MAKAASWKLKDTYCSMGDLLTITVCVNGYMVEINGRDSTHDWVVSKIICNSMQEVVDLINEISSMPKG